MKYVVTLRDRTYEVEVEEGEAMILDEYEAKATAASPQPAAPSAETTTAFSAPAASPASPTPGNGTSVCAPLPGNILTINVAPGDAVHEGDVLLLIEAMKMENEVVSPTDGTVSAIHVSSGQMVNTGDLLLEI